MKIDGPGISTPVSAVAEPYLPTPSVSGVGVFRDVLNIAQTAVSGASSLGLGGISPEFTALLGQQLQAQKEMEVTSMLSNIEKSKHESRMAAIRNIRVG